MAQPMGFHAYLFSPAICQTILGFILDCLSLVSVLVLHYLDNFLVVGYGSGNVTSAAVPLCSALRLEGAIISPKSILEPVPEIDWLGKCLVFWGELARVFAMAGGVANHGWPVAAHCHFAHVPSACTPGGRSLFLGPETTNWDPPFAGRLVVPHHLG